MPNPSEIVAGLSEERETPWPIAEPAIVQAMLDELAGPDFGGGYVVQMPGGERIDPAEVWLPDVGGWVRADGSLLMLDRGRGYFGLEQDDAATVRAHLLEHPNAE